MSKKVVKVLVGVTGFPAFLLLFVAPIILSVKDFPWCVYFPCSSLTALIMSAEREKKKGRELYEYDKRSNLLCREGTNWRNRVFTILYVWPYAAVWIDP
jgi:hypothetical protein